jgi:hypothetical protein
VNLRPGVPLPGYCSDTDRTSSWRATANAEGSLRIVPTGQVCRGGGGAPGVPAQEVGPGGAEGDRRRGLRELLLNRLGHGIGVAVTRPPTSSRGASCPWRWGTLQIEPGIYPGQGRFGERIGDPRVAVTETGCELSSLPRGAHRPRAEGGGGAPRRLGRRGDATARGEAGASPPLLFKTSRVPV